MGCVAGDFTHVAGLPPPLLRIAGAWAGRCSLFSLLYHYQPGVFFNLESEADSMHRRPPAGSDADHPKSDEGSASLAFSVPSK